MYHLKRFLTTRHGGAFPKHTEVVLKFCGAAMFTPWVVARNYERDITEIFRMEVRQSLVIIHDVGSVTVNLTAARLGSDTGKMALKNALNASRAPSA